MNRNACCSAVAVLCLMATTNCGSGNNTHNYIHNNMTPVITVTSGTPQSHAINGAFGTPLAATVTANGSPASGLVVTFAAPATGASGTFAGGVNTATTNANGVATSTPFTANATAGNYTVTGSVTGLTTTASFALTNSAAAPASNIAVSSGTPQTATAGAAFGAPLVAFVSNAAGGPVSGATVTFT